MAIVRQQKANGLVHRLDRELLNLKMLYLKLPALSKSMRLALAEDRATPCSVAKHPP